MIRTWLLTVAFVSPLAGLAQRTWDTIPIMPDRYLAKAALFKKEPVVKNKTLFLGSSLSGTERWSMLLKDSSVINRVIEGDNTYGVLNRVNDVVIRQPSAVFLMIGINDLSKGTPDDVVMENIFSIVHKLKRGSKATKIFVESILPVNPSFKNFPSGYDKNEHIEVVNEQIAKYAERMGFTYVDLYSDFTDKQHFLQTAYSTDGVHLNHAGYVHWIEVLKKNKCL